MPTVTRPTRAATWTNLWLVYILWGSTYLGIALAIETAPPMWAMGVRVAGAGFLVAALLVITRGPSVLRVPLGQAARAAGIGAMMFSAGIGSVAMGERYVPVGVAALLIATSPLIGVVLRRLTGDRAHRLTWMGVLLGLVGLVILLRPTGEAVTTERFIWSVLIVLGAVVWVIGSFITPRVDVPRDPLVLVAYEMGIGGLFFFLWSALLGERVDLSAISGRSWFGIVYLLLAGVVGYACFTWLITNVPLSLAQTYAYVNPVVAVILGWAILGQSLTVAVLLGGAVTLLGVVLVISGERR